MLKETSCNEEKIRRQQIKKGEVTSFKTVTSSEEPHVEVKSIKAKNYTASVAEANKTLPKRNEHALLEIPIICGRDASSLSLDQVWVFWQI